MSCCARRKELCASPDRPAHHGPQGFRNVPHHVQHGARGFLKWKLGLGPKEEGQCPLAPGGPYEPEVAAPDLDRISNPAADKVQITWIGHSTFLIQLEGQNILTDPVFSDRCSPLPFVGPKRVAPTGLPFDKLPRISAVLISHDHYDHLDAPTVKRLAGKTRFFVPLGLEKWFANKGIPNVTELDWRQSSSVDPLRVHCVPAVHFSGRKPWGRNQTLWCGWVIESRLGNVYFAGDTGYGPRFKEIGKRFGPMRVSMIPIGQYLPRWFMRPVHANPADAVKIHQDVRSQHSIGCHWGTFKLAAEPMGEPPLRLGQARKEAGIEDSRFVVLKIGETRSF